MRQRKRQFSTGPVQAREWRSTYDRLASELVDGVLVKSAPNMHAFEACKYVATADMLRVVVRCNSGSIAAFQWGEFRGWFPTVEAAIADARVPRLPRSAFQ